MTPLYPDLAAPPTGWTGGRMGAAIKLVPPGAWLDSARASIIVSPLVPRSRALPAPGVIIEQALAAELARFPMDMVSREGPTPVIATSGLEGVRLEVTLKGLGDGRIQRRIYISYQDEAFLYGIHYLADEATFPVFLEVFEAAAASVEPMQRA